VLAEFLVASAVGDPSPLRNAWDDFDVTTPSGVRVEVKSSAYLQSWNQRQVSKIVFTGLTGRSLLGATAEYGDERGLRADVYVFAIHTCREPDEYDMLDLGAWEFRVLGAAALREHGYRSITKHLLDRIAPTPCPFDELLNVIERTFREDRRAG